jgi:hypothetical protein
MSAHLTNFGIPGIDVVPYGIHMCHFYLSQQELVGGLVPFFQAGLSNNERCIWVAAASVPASKIRKEIAKSSELAHGLAIGRLVLADVAARYGKPATLDAEATVQRWIDEEERALANGLQGLRIAGDASFVPRSDWARLMEYEKKLHERIKGRRIVACCCYHRGDCQPVDILEVAHRHDGALNHADEHWEVFLHPPAAPACDTASRR